MYDNNNPTDGQNSSTRANLTPSSKSNPCPVCGRTKDGDCRISHDGKMVLCHQNFDNAKTQQPDLWHFDGPTSDGRCGIYVFKEESENSQPVAKKPRAKKKKYPPAPIPIGAKLLRLPAPGQSPQPEQLAKDTPKDIPHNALQTTYDYSPTQKVVRYEWPDATNPKGHDKTYRQFHFDSDGKKVWKKGDARWPAYRIDEVVELLKTVPDGEPILIPMLEGEPNVELARSISLAGITLQGSNWSDPETLKTLETLRATGKNVCLAKIRDNDDTGVKKGTGVGLVANHIQFPCIVIDPRVIYPDIPEKGDIREILEAIGSDEFLKRLESEIASQAAAMTAIEEKKVFKAPSSQAAEKVLTHERFKSPSVDLRQEITALVNAGTTGSELTAALLELSRGSNAQQIQRIYEEILEEADREEQRLDRKADLEKLVEISNRRLTLEKYLHPNLAEPIKKVVAWMGVDSEAVLTHLLPIAAGLINPNSRIVVKKCTNFVEPCLLYSAVIAETGSRKTPLLNIPKAPLVKLQAEEDARYKAELDAYKEEIEAYNHRPKENKDDAPPVPPHPPREFYVDNITVESLDEIKGWQPDRAFTMIKDELSGLFASHGAYKGGKGSDKESFLSGWGGGGVKKNRRSKDSRVSLARDSLSITGGIQPDKLRALFGDFTDAQGEWARFLWYQMPMRPYKIPRHDAAYSLGDLLESIYRKLDSLPELEFYFSKEGQKFYDDWYDKRYEQTRNETKPGLKAAMAKMPGQAARLIGVLHVLNGVSSQAPEVQEEISLTTVRAGCHLAQFYLGQVTLLQGEGDALDGELTPVLKSLLEKVNELGKLTATQAKKAVWGLRKIAPDKIRRYFDELAAMDLAKVQGTGSRLTLISKVLRTVDEMSVNPQQHQQNQNPDSARIPEKSNSEVLRTVDEVLMESQQAESYIYQEVQEINDQTVDVVDGVQTFDTDTQPLNLEPDTDAVEISVEESEISEKTSTPSTLARLEPETLTQQGKIGVDESSTLPSTVEESSTLSSTKTNVGKKHRTFEIGDRVVIAEVGSIHQGQHGDVVSVRYGSRETEYIVKLDKESRGSKQVRVTVPKGSKLTFLMKL